MIRVINDDDDDVVSHDMVIFNTKKKTDVGNFPKIINYLDRDRPREVDRRGYIDIENIIRFFFILNIEDVITIVFNKRLREICN